MKDWQIKKEHLFIAITTLLLVALTLYSWGRPLIAKSGIVKLWHGTVYSSENSQHLTDWYTFSHIVHGFLFFWFLHYLFHNKSLGWLLLIAIFIESGWELLENTDYVINRYREATISLDYFGDSVINSISDIIAMIVGFMIAAYIPAATSIIIVLVLEIGMAYAIHDNLTLNVIMLLYPFDIIKDWQSLGGPFSKGF